MDPMDPRSFFQLGISPNSPSADRIRLQPESKDQSMIIKTSTRKSPYSSASGLILRFFKISLTSDVQSRPKVQDSSLKLLQDPLQLHLLRFAGHENKTKIHMIFSDSWPKQKNICRFPIVFPRFSGWTKGKNNKQIKTNRRSEITQRQLPGL